MARPDQEGPSPRAAQSSEQEYGGGVKPETQWYLVEALANARAEVVREDDYEAKQRLLNHFAGLLAGFRYLSEITQDEEQTWFRKMLIAVGYEPPDPPPPGVSQAIYVGDPKKRPPQSPVPENPAAFVRSIPGPDREFDVHGAKFRVIAAEIYDTAVVIRWRSAPEPDIWAAFPEEAAALQGDMDGLEEWATDELRRKAAQRMTMRRLHQFSLGDDVGTGYLPSGSGSGGRPGEMAGDARFQPAPPSTASALTLSWLGLDVTIPLN